MESLNLNMLATSLPNSNLANAEAELMNNFKAAAHSITTLYRSSRRTSKRAYNAGYAAACQDLLLMIQQGVSTSESLDPNGGGMTIGRIMDYIEARLEAIKSREEEEDEDEEKEKDRERDRERARQSVTPTASEAKSASRRFPDKSQQATPVTTPRLKEQSVASAPLTPHTPGAVPQQNRPPFAPLASATPSMSPLRPSSAPLPLALQQRKTRSSAISKEAALATASTSTVPFAFASSSPSTPISNFLSMRQQQQQQSPFQSPLSLSAPSVAIIAPTPLSPQQQPEPTLNTVGMKRRLNTMLSDSSTPLASGSARRRTRSSRNVAANQNQNNGSDQTQGSEAMDVEEECSRERKRVARR